MALFARLMCTGGANDENDDVTMDQIDEIDDREGNKVPKTKVGFHFESAKTANGDLLSILNQT